MTIGNRIRVSRELKGMTQEELGSACGTTKQTIFKYENSVVTNIPLDRVEKIADILDVSPIYLLGWDDRFSAPTNLAPMPFVVSRPRVGSIACGTPIIAEQNIECYDAVPDWVHCDFTLVCRGDSMIGARIFDGDIVCIRLQPDVENGEIAAVMVDGDEATLKRIKKFDDHIILEPENPNYRPQSFWDEDMARIRILGKATHFISTIK